MKKCGRQQDEVRAHNKCEKMFSLHTNIVTRTWKAKTSREKSKVQKGHFFCSSTTTLRVLNAFYLDYTTAF